MLSSCSRRTRAHFRATDGKHANVTSLATAMHCVAGGLGVTVAPRSAVATATEGNGPATVRFTAPAPTRTIGLVYRGFTGAADRIHWLVSILDATRQSSVGRSSVGRGPSSASSASCTTAIADSPAGAPQ
ncbi:MAG: LysR substrate-binding domain-containing protein [Rhodococcus sp. (in: high G+C Gram-positive bacteria)]|uniref:LysR substrate-binding domain-containing protein n=1 Tax=Rhodococcus sp. TaxID=1831 RepID=UPI003BB0A0B0